MQSLEHMDWGNISIILFWRLAPKGVVITQNDLACLPQDRVLLDQRTAREIRFSWVTPHQAMRLRHDIAGNKIGVSELQGRWMKTAVVLLWKLARGQVVRLMQRDMDAVPDDQSLLSHSHPDGLEYRFLPHAEAEKVLEWEKEHEGHDPYNAGPVPIVRRPQ